MVRTISGTEAERMRSRVKDGQSPECHSQKWNFLTEHKHSRRLIVMTRKGMIRNPRNGDSLSEVAWGRERVEHELACDQEM